MRTIHTVRGFRHLMIFTFVLGVLCAGLLLMTRAASAGLSAGTPTDTSEASPNVCNANWQIVTNPNPGSYDNELLGVGAGGPSDAWAVGYYKNTDFHTFTLIEHWNGSSWSVVSSPNPYPGGYQQLTGVAAVSSNDVWAIGTYPGIGTPYGLAFSEHWNGSSWTIVSTQDPGSGHGLYGVAAAGPNDVWAVGTYEPGNISHALIEHWNGSSWSVVSSPNVGPSNLDAVTALGSNDVWATGTYYDNDSYGHTLIEHWNGSSWSVVSSPDVGSSNNELYGVAAAGPNDVWAVGIYYSLSTSTGGILTEHWNGSSWSVVPSPHISDSDTLRSVAVAASNDVWAVGTSDYGSTLIEHWNGSSWSIVSAPNPGTSIRDLYGVTVAAPNDVWAVGIKGNCIGCGDSLIERYDGTGFSDVPSGSTFYPYVTCLASRSIVGGYSDCTFRPGNPVTRGQLSKIVALSANFTEPHTEQTFEDVPVGSTFHLYIERLASRSIISGYACGGPGEPCGPGNKPYFRTGNNVTRGQTSKIVAIAKGLPAPTPGQQTFQDVAVNSTFWQWIEELSTAGAIGGYACGGPGEPCGPGNKPYFRPGNSVTRGQSSKIVANTFFPGCQSSKEVK